MKAHYPRTEINMKRIALLMAAGLLALAGCDEMKPQSLKERNADTYEEWASTHVKRLYQVCQDQYRAGQMVEVEGKAEEALRLDPDHEGFMLLLGKVQIELGKSDAAEETLSRLAEVSPKRFDVPYFIGIARERRGDLQGAFDSYRKAEQLSGGRASEITAAIAEVLVSMGQPVDAQEYLEARMPAPGHAEARIFELAGRIAMRLGQYVKATDHLHRACLMDAENVRYAEMLAEAQLKSGQFADAIGTLHGIVERDDVELPSRVYVMLGDCQLAMDESREAIRSYMKACQTDARNVVAWTSLAKGHLAADQLDHAVDAARHALKLAPDNLDASQILAFALLRQNEVVEAARVLKAARKRHPRDTMITCLMGQTYAAVGKAEKARSFYNYALKLDPKCAMAQKLLASTR
jgi:tetratricopeptide (TPR) repeat protein